MKIWLSLAILMIFSVGLITPSFAQLSESLQISIDQTEYLPGSYVKISASTSQVIPFEGLKFSVIDTSGKIIEKGILYPTDGKFNTSIFISSVTPVYGKYQINFDYATTKQLITFDVVPDVKDSSMFSISTEKPVYGIGDSVKISGRLNTSWIPYVNFEISQVNNSDPEKDFSQPVVNLLKTNERLKLDAQGKFVYVFEIPNSTTRIGDYSVTVSENIGSKKIFFSVVNDPNNYTVSSAPLTLKLNQDEYVLNVDKTIYITGRVQNILERSDYVTSSVTVSLLGSDNKPILMDRAIKDKNGSAINSEKIPYELTITPDETGYFYVSTDLIRQVFSPGTYTFQANYLGNSVKDSFQIVDELESLTPGIKLDNLIYGLNTNLHLDGFLPINEKYATIEIIKPDGSILNYGAVIENQKISWDWNTPSFESGTGLYRVAVSAPSFYDSVLFKISVDPENDSLPEKNLLINTDKPIYKAGEKILLSGHVKIGKTLSSVFSIPERAVITIQDKNNLYKEILQSSVYPNDLGEFSGTFVLTPTIFPTGQYVVKVNYGSLQSSQIFSVTNDVIFGIDDPVEFLVHTDKNEYNLGDSVLISGKPNKLIYVEKYDISVIQQSKNEINCGSFYCGTHVGTVTSIRPTPTGSFEYEFKIPNDPKFLGHYEAVIDTNFATKHLTFDVSEKSLKTEEVPAKIETYVEKQNRLTDETFSIEMSNKVVNSSNLLPRVLSGNLISTPGNEESVNLQILTDTGICIIGSETNCLVSESTRKPGQIFDIVTIDQINYKVRYSGTDARLEKFNILPEDDSSFLPLENWTINIIKDGQPSKFYYKLTYKNSD